MHNGIVDRLTVAVVIMTVVVCSFSVMRSGDSIGDEGAHALAEALKENTTVMSIALYGEL